MGRSANGEFANNGANTDRRRSGLLESGANSRNCEDRPNTCDRIARAENDSRSVVYGLYHPRRGFTLFDAMIKNSLYFRSPAAFDEILLKRDFALRRYHPAFDGLI